MAKKLKHETLADKIAGVLNTTPASYDPEDDTVDDTRAKLIEEFEEGDEDDDNLLNTFRKKNVELLADFDQRYAGKTTSRKQLYDSDENESENQNESEVENESEEESRESIDSDEEEKDSADDESIDSNADSNEETDDSDEGDDTIDEHHEGEVIAESATNFKHFKETDVSSQVKKGICARNQMKMWENLLELRIQLQKCLIVANKFPQNETYTEIKKQSGREFSDQVTVTKNSLTNLLDKLLLLQKLSLSKYPETKKLNKKGAKPITTENNDEEIPSETDDGNTDEETEEEEDAVPKKKRKLSDFENHISASHALYKVYRNSVIQKWNDKTRIAVLKHNTSSHSVLNHIEHTLSDKSKLRKRTQLKKSEYTIVGQEDPKEITENHNNDRLTEDYNTEIFDDDDFYHQLLRELIEVRSADLTDPIQLGRQWIQLQKLRNKMKRKIDTRATKGRKIRYTVHTKLVNFMAPVDEQLWTDQAKTDLYNSLFGKKEYSVVSESSNTT